jgi:hypothetical protein
MEEVLPVGAGVVLGLVLANRGGRWRWVALVALSLLLGFAAAYVTGELAVSWVYVLIDTAQVLAASAMTWLLAARWRRSRSAEARRSA